MQSRAHTRTIRGSRQGRSGFGKYTSVSQRLREIQADNPYGSCWSAYFSFFLLPHQSWPIFWESFTPTSDCFSKMDVLLHSLERICGWFGVSCIMLLYDARNMVGYTLYIIAAMTFGATNGICMILRMQLVAVDDSEYFEFCRDESCSFALSLFMIWTGAFALFIGIIFETYNHYGQVPMFVALIFMSIIFLKCIIMFGKYIRANWKPFHQLLNSDEVDFSKVANMIHALEEDKSLTRSLRDLYNDFSEFGDMQERTVPAQRGAPSVNKHENTYSPEQEMLLSSSTSKETVSTDN